MSGQTSKLTQVLNVTIIVFVDNIAVVNPRQQMKGKSKKLFPLCLEPNKGDAVGRTVATSAKDNGLCASSHHNSSFEVISLESR